MNVGQQVWLGDLARSLARLAPRDDHTVAVLAGMLGFGFESSEPGSATSDESRPSDRTPTPEPVEHPRDPGSAHRGRTHLPSAATATPTDAAPTMEGASPVPLGAKLDELPLLRRVPPRGTRRPTPWSMAEPLPPVSERHLYGRLRHEPLLRPRWSRELLYAAIASEVADGPIDEAAAVDAVARGLVLAALPQLTRWSLARGVQMLVDEGPGMEPFRRDALEVAHALRRVVGPAGLEEQHFESSPGHGVSDGWLARRRPYTPPEPGTPVLVVSDLGVSGKSRSVRGDWLNLARRLAQRHSAFIALVPYGPGRWPVELARRFVLIQWDRSTTVSAVKTARRAHGSAA